MCAPKIPKRKDPISLSLAAKLAASPSQQRAMLPGSPTSIVGSVTGPKKKTNTAIV